LADPATDQLPSEVTEGADPLDALQLGQLPKPNVLFLLQSPVPSADCLLKHLLVLEVSKVVLVLVGSTGSRPDEVLELLKKMHLPAPTPSTGKKSSPSISLEQVDLGRHFRPPLILLDVFRPTMGTAPPYHTGSATFQVACPHRASPMDRMKLPSPQASMHPDNPSSIHLDP